MLFDGSEAEVCSRCGFNSSLWRRPDTTVVFGMLGYWWRHATAGICDEDLNRRPGPEVWSALEYGLHSAMVIPILRDGIEQVLAEDGCHVVDPCPQVDTEDATHPLTLDPTSILDALEIEGNVMASLVDAHPDGWDHIGHMENGPWQAEAALLHAVHDTTHHFLDVAEGLATIKAAGPTQHAIIESIDTSGLGRDGSRGRHRPFEAVYLRSAEAHTQDQSTAAEPAGEILAITGIDWTALRPGTRLQAGAALLELSYPATALSEAPGWFAWARRPGLIQTGNAVIVSP